LARWSSVTAVGWALRAIDGLPETTYAQLQEVWFFMARHLHHWLDLMEAVLIIGIMLAIAWLTWQALTTAYSPVVNILSRF
jgi:hypothetical protein